MVPPKPIDPKSVSLLDLCDNIQDKWEDDFAVSRIYVVAHRGNTVRGQKIGIPDNSIPNIREAIDAGADMVELDVRPTKDGELILMHNETIESTTTGTGKVSDMTLAQIQSYEMTRYGKVYRDEEGNSYRVPTLREALECTKDKIYVNLDVASKNVNPVQLITILQDVGVEDQVMIYDSASNIGEYYKYAPLIAFHPFISKPDDVDKYTQYVSAKLFQYTNSTYLNKTIEQFGYKVHLKKKLSYSNLLDSYDQKIREGDFTPLDRFIESGSDFVQTDVAELVINYLEGKGLR